MTNGDLRRGEGPVDANETSVGLIGHFRDRPDTRFFGLLEPPWVPRS